jgi:hypothetical protein
MTEEPMCCSVHPDAVAGWQCSTEACKRHLCGKCTARLIKLFTCCTCGGPARQLTVSRKSISRAHWLVAAVRYPLGAGLGIVVAVAIVSAALAVLAEVLEAQRHQLDGVVHAVRLGLLFAYVLVSIDRTARGAEPGKLLRCARTMAATWLIWVPSVGYLLLLGVPGAAAQHDWVLWLFATLSLLYLPLALAVAVTDASFVDAVNPFKMFEHMCRLGKTYVATLAAAVVLAGLSVLAASQAASIQQAVAVPVVGDAVAQLPTLAVLAMLGHVVGMVAYVHGDLIGWGTAALFVEPRFPHMVAEGRRKISTRPIARVTGEVPTDARPGEAPPPGERADAAKLTSALKAEELVRALRIYEGRPSWSAASIDDRQLVVLARTAARAKKLVLAQRLLEEACARNSRSAGQAWLALAQLHADALGQADKARAIYGRIVAEFPGSEAAKLAAVQGGNAGRDLTA